MTSRQQYLRRRLTRPFKALVDMSAGHVAIGLHKLTRRLDPDRSAERAGRLAKADLTAGVVGEFPELQGVMGRYYALHDREDADIAEAIREHYKPVGPSDAVPTAKIAIAVALGILVVIFYAMTLVKGPGVLQRPL